MAYKGEVIADSSGHWYGNALVFATEPEAYAYIRGLMCRWLLVRDTRTVETDEPVNYTWDVDQHKAVSLEVAP